MFSYQIGCLAILFLAFSACSYRVQGVPVKAGEAPDSVTTKKAMYDCRKEVEEITRDRWAVGMVEVNRLRSEKELMHQRCMEAKGYTFQEQ